MVKLQLIEILKMLVKLDNEGISKGLAKLDNKKTRRKQREFKHLNIGRLKVGMVWLEIVSNFENFQTRPFLILSVQCLKMFEEFKHWTPKSGNV